MNTARSRAVLLSAVVMIGSAGLAAEMSLGNLGPWGLPRDFPEQNADALAAIGDVAAILLERNPDTADATTARLMLERYNITILKLQNEAP